MRYSSFGEKELLRTGYTVTKKVMLESDGRVHYVLINCIQPDAFNLENMCIQPTKNNSISNILSDVAD